MKGKDYKSGEFKPTLSAESLVADGAEMFVR